MCRAICIWHDVLSWYPGVGWYIAILGALGIAVAVLRDLTKIGGREKAVWIFVTISLLLLELHSISLDKAVHDKEQNDARNEQLRQFAAIAQGINDTSTRNQDNFDATMSSMRSLIATAQQTNKNTQPLANVRQYSLGLDAVPGVPFIVAATVKVPFDVWFGN
jgi:ABC-type transport system involved in cytochrome bd biosynthesis fused ATPase/permease subunit